MAMDRVNPVNPKIQSIPIQTECGDDFGGGCVTCQNLLSGGNLLQIGLCLCRLFRNKSLHTYLTRRRIRVEGWATHFVTHSSTTVEILFVEEMLTPPARCVYRSRSSRTFFAKSLCPFHAWNS